jgi:hypothetical protein
MRIFVPFALLLAALPVCAPAQVTDWCIPSAADKAALDQLPATAPAFTEWENLNATLIRSPGFPWPHLALPTLYGTPVFQNKDEKARHAKAFVAACPESLDGRRQLARLDDKAFLAASAEKLRALVTVCRKGTF